MSASFYMDRISERVWELPYSNPHILQMRGPVTCPSSLHQGPHKAHYPGATACPGFPPAHLWPINGGLLEAGSHHGISVNSATDAASTADIFSTLNLSRQLNPDGLITSFTCFLHVRLMPVPWDSLRLRKRGRGGREWVKRGNPSQSCRTVQTVLKRLTAKQTLSRL